MRNISLASLGKISSQDNVESVLVVEVYWNGQPTRYCDRRFNQDGLYGYLISISGIEDIVDISSNASSVSLSVVLDDTDGSIKNVFNTTDVHKTYCKVYQWFTGIPFNDAFVIFEGQISSPIEWKEGARTFSFQIVSQLEDIEVGFSIEEGKFDFMPYDLVGKAWPLVFGTVGGLVPLKMLEAPNGVLASGFAIVDEDIWAAELTEYEARISELTALQRDAYKAGQAEAIIASQYKGFLPSVADDPSAANSHDQAATNYFQQASDYAQEKARMGLEYSAKQQERDLQLAYNIRVIPIINSNIPSGTAFQFALGDSYIATGLVIANALVITSIEPNIDPNQQTTYINSDTETSPVSVGVLKANSGINKFTWIDGGTEIRAINFPMKYIVSIGHSTVLNVWGKTQGLRAVVPPAFYSVERTNYGSLPVTLITFPRPLTSYTQVKWDSDEVDVDVRGEVGTNVVDIIRYLIDNYCQGIGIDEDSFAHVRTRVSPYPANFAVLQRKNVVQMLQEIAYQSRCAIYINDRKFFLIYLPEDRLPVDAIGDSSIEVSSVSIGCTSTDRLITKYVAEWRRDLRQSEPFQFIYRYNVQKYGIQESSVDFYIYNNAELVQKSAEFWMIRESNTWKILKCRTVLSKLRLETFDPITVSFVDNLVANEPVTGIIQRATYLPDEDCIEMEVWLPVRFGEMTRYEFAFPGEVSSVYPVLNDGNAFTGNPYEDARGQLYEPSYTPWGFQSFQGTNSYTQGRGVPIGDATDTAPPPVITALSTVPFSGFRPPDLSLFNDQKQYQVKPFEQATFAKLNPNTFFGKVVSKQGETTYSVSVYLKGFTQAPTTMSVEIGSIKPGETLPPGYPLAVYRTTFVLATGDTTFEYWCQPPLWVPGIEQEETVPIGDNGEDDGGGEFDSGDNGDDGLPDGADDPNPDEEPPPPPPGGGNDGAGDSDGDGFPSDLPPAENSDPPDSEPGDSGSGSPPDSYNDAGGSGDVA